MKRGSTLIEVLVAISISLIIIPLILNIFLYQIKIYKGTLQNSRSNFSVNEAFMYIQYKVKDNNKQVIVENNQIILFTEANNDKEVISNHNNCITITYYDKYGERYYYESKNNIITGIENFIVEEKNDYIIVSIIFKEDKEYSRCISLKK